MTEKKRLVPYLLWAFGLGWALHIAAAVMYKQGNRTVYGLILTASMFAPLAAAMLSKGGVKGLGWRPRIKKDWKYILLAWLSPAVLGAVGAALYYLLFPAAFDTGFGYIRAQVGEEGLAQLEAQGLTLKAYTVTACVQSVTWAPWVNMLPALGEEAGWRGVMTPALRERFGVIKGRIIGGVIWGAWHWPIMLMTGYEYGTEYYGAPITGMVMFCIFTTAAGILLDWLYGRTDCIWLPALGHGAINAFTVPVLFLDAAYSDRLLLGPVMIGAVSGLPLIIAAVLICVRESKSA